MSKTGKNRPHVIATEHTRAALAAVLPPGWAEAVQEPVTLDTSEPEPDVMVYRGTVDDDPTSHPTPADVPLVVEVAHSTLPRAGSGSGVCTPERHPGVLDRVSG